MRRPADPPARALVPDGAHLTSNEQKLAIIHIVDCTQHRDIAQKEFQVELNVTPRLSSNAVPLLVYNITSSIGIMGPIKAPRLSACSISPKTPDRGRHSYSVNIWRDRFAGLS
jgi:hypothetical protein